MIMSFAHLDTWTSLLFVLEGTVAQNVKEILYASKVWRGADKTEAAEEEDTISSLRYGEAAVFAHRV